MSTDDRKWEIIESEYLIRRPWLTARRDRVKLPTAPRMDLKTADFQRFFFCENQILPLLLPLSFIFI